MLLVSFEKALFLVKTTKLTSLQKSFFSEKKKNCREPEIFKQRRQKTKKFLKQTNFSGILVLFLCCVLFKDRISRGLFLLEQSLNSLSQYGNIPSLLTFAKVFNSCKSGTKSSNAGIPWISIWTGREEQNGTSWREQKNPSSFPPKRIKTYLNKKDAPRSLRQRWYLKVMRKILYLLPLFAAQVFCLAFSFWGPENLDSCQLGMEEVSVKLAPFLENCLILDFLFDVTLLGRRSQLSLSRSLFGGIQNFGWKKQFITWKDPGIEMRRWSGVGQILLIPIENEPLNLLSHQTSEAGKFGTVWRRNICWKSQAEWWPDLSERCRWLGWVQSISQN